MAAFELEEFETAKTAFEHGQKLAPSNTQFKTWLRKCDAEIQSESGVPTATTVSSAALPNKSHHVTPSPTTTTTAPVTVPATNTQPTLVPGRIRHEWYQTATAVTITVFAKGIQKQDVALNVQPREV